MSTVKTLDYLAAKTAREMVEMATKPSNEGGLGTAAKDLENLITKALGVLQSQGVYALFLYLYSQSGTDKPIKKGAALIVEKLWNALGEEPASHLRILNNGHKLQGWNKALQQKNRVLADVTEHITANLDTLLLVRDLYEQTLIYARYHAKALQEKE